jgi:ribosomal protein L37AE/L43A
LELQELGVGLKLDEIENLRKSLQNCPDCGSTEGFWLVAKRDKTYFQCKHCAAILEICEIHPHSKTIKDTKRFLGKLRI